MILKFIKILQIILKIAEQICIYQNDNYQNLLVLPQSISVRSFVVNVNHLSLF